MKFFIIAGERSGDLHGANLVRELKRQHPTAEIVAYGGELMEEAGANLLKHYREFSVMGFLNVLLQFRKIAKTFTQCQNDLLAAQPDALILIDFAGFNLRMAQFAKSKGIRTCYYISPKVWAWNQQRALTLKKVVDELYVIFPFEVAFFKQYNYDVWYVGNPLLDAIQGFVPHPEFKAQHQLDNRPIIALLPGSRKQEVERMLSKMLVAVNQLDGYQIVVAGVSNLPATLYTSLLSAYPSVKLITDASYDVLHIAEAALVTSGTATLETALFNVPQVVCYETDWFSYQIGKKVIRVPYISLVNLIAQREIVKELIQAEFNETQLKKELVAIVGQGDKRQRVLEGYVQLHQLMGEAGASARTAQFILNRSINTREEANR
ncbi:MAG: lipid-A-disaccharide synthase [Spirosomataceae bacterium]